MKDFRPYAIAIALFILFLSLQSCASRCKAHSGKWDTVRKR